MPAGSFIKQYNETKNKEALRQEAFHYFNDKYFKTPFQEYWIIEQHERFIARRLKFFMPGRVYTYQYLPHGKEEMSFYDRRPFVYVIGEFVSESTGYNILQGINLNFLPEAARVNFIDMAYKIFGNSYKLADALSDKERLSLMKEVHKFITNWYFMTTNFDRVGRIGIEFAIRNYDIQLMRQPVLIELEDFSMIPYFTPKELIGKPPGYVYALYLKNKADILKRSLEKNRNNTQALINQKKYKKPGT